MVTQQELEDLKSAFFPLRPFIMAAKWPWDHLVQIQCTKPPHVVKRTAELLAEVRRNEEGYHLKGQ